MRARFRAAWVLALAVAPAAACAPIISADFDGYGPRGQAGEVGAATGGGAGSTAGAGGGGGADDGGVSGSGGTLAGGGGGGGIGTGGAGGASGSQGGGPGQGGSAIDDGGVADAHGGQGGVGGRAQPDGSDASLVIDASSDESSPGHDAEGEDTALPEAARDAASDAAARDAPNGSVVINEIRATGDDWVELSNPGTAPASLDLFSLAQANGNNGPPDLAEALTFQQGTTVAPGAYLLVVGKAAATGGPTADCRGLATSCFTVTWGVSASGGEFVYLLSPARAILEAIPFPMTGTDAAPPTGFSYGRLPDGTGAFTTTLSTPGAHNR